METSGISQGFQLAKKVRVASLQGDVFLPAARALLIPSCRGRALPGTSKQSLLALDRELLDPGSHRLLHRQGCVGLLLPQERIPEAGVCPQQGAPQAGVAGMSLSPPRAEFLALTPSKPLRQYLELIFSQPDSFCCGPLNHFSLCPLISHTFPVCCCTLPFPAVRQEFCSSSRGRGCFPNGRQSQGFRGPPQTFIPFFPFLLQPIFHFWIPASLPADPISALSC